ncbi:MAG: MerR family transcriptional regulator [Acidimicrobiaceae bacterium]|nr:MerR family transcriptional regulator [Acidimicrobiaceae bacterium]
MTMLSSRQAAHRLGVKVETLYAYVSRGLLTSHRDEAHRASVFDEREVERLARRGRPRAASRTPTLDIDIATAITSTHTPTGGYEVRFRGHPAAELAATVAFEQVAELLWTGELTASPAPPWAGSTVTVAGERMMDRVRVAAPPQWRPAPGTVGRRRVAAEGGASSPPSWTRCPCSMTGASPPPPAGCAYRAPSPAACGAVSRRGGPRRVRCVRSTVRWC